MSVELKEELTAVTFLTGLIEPLTSYCLTNAAAIAIVQWQKRSLVSHSQ